MDLTRYVEELKQQLLATAELGGGQMTATADRLVPHLDGMVRLILFDALSAAADEITTELAPGSVAVRLRGREPEFDVVAPPSSSMTSSDVTAATILTAAPNPPTELPTDGDDGEIARITLRLPENLKTQVEHAAAADRLSVNAWLVRAVADAVAGRRPPPPQITTNPVGGQHLTGWAR